MVSLLTTFVLTIATRSTWAQAQLPGSCNGTSDGSAASAAEAVFEADNGACLTAAAACLQASPPGPATCDFECTAGLSALESACHDSTLCELAANTPALVFRAAACYPASCDASTASGVLASWRGRLCGATGDCSAIALGCDYQLPTYTIWLIVGGVAGGFALCCGGLFAAWACCCASKAELDGSDGALAGDEEGGYFAVADESGEGGGEGGDADEAEEGGVGFRSAPRRPPPPRVFHSLNSSEASRAGGGTGAEMGAEFDAAPLRALESESAAAGVSGFTVAAPRGAAAASLSSATYAAR